MPQEDSSQLTALKSMLTPFLKAVSKALSHVPEGRNSILENKVIFNEILQNLPAENSTSNFCTNLTHASDILQNEFDQLRRINIQYVTRQFLGAINSIQIFSTRRRLQTNIIRPK